VKDEIYGSRLVLFAPLYISNHCRNECLYCAFRATNKALHRRALTQEEVANEVRVLVNQGHKRLLLVAGESYPDADGLDYILKAIDTVYATRTGRGEIRRVNVNIAPLSVDDFRRIKARNIGTYQLFQETYTAPPTPGSPGRCEAQLRLARDRVRPGDAGWDRRCRRGGALRLHDWKFEVLRCCGMRSTWRRGSASGRTPSACRASSRRWGQAWRAGRAAR